MSALAPTLQAFLTERLISQRQASPQTVAAYRDTFRLLLGFAAQRTGRAPSKLDLEDLDAPLIGAFLEHLQSERGNAVTTRNARLAAVHSLFRFAALRHPEHATLIARVLAIPTKRSERAFVTFLTEPETDALLAGPDRSRWIGRRTHALLLTAIQTGVSEELCRHERKRASCLQERRITPSWSRVWRSPPARSAASPEGERSAAPAGRPRRRGVHEPGRGASSPRGWSMTRSFARGCARRSSCPTAAGCLTR
jgi:integrase